MLQVKECGLGKKRGPAPSYDAKRGEDGAGSIDRMGTCGMGFARCRSRDRLGMTGERERSRAKMPPRWSGWKLMYFLPTLSHSESG